jgi:hypothetical protein
MRLVSACFGLALWLAATLGASMASAAPSKALYFDGVDDYIEIPDSSSLDVTGFITMEAWVNFTGYKNCCWNWVLVKTYSHPSNNTSYALSFSNHYWDAASSDKLLAGVGITPGNDGADQFFVDAAPVRNGFWHHIAFTFDSAASESRLYIDGVLSGIKPTSGQIRTTDFSVTIGTYLGWVPGFFQGYIDEVRIWNVARTSAQIAESMNRDLTGTEPGLVGYWNFSEGDGTTAYDLSGNGNHGTIYGQPLWVTSGPDLQPAAVSIPGTLALLAFPLLLAAARLRPAA